MSYTRWLGLWLCSTLPAPAANGQLPSGDAGIAVRYPGDRGIAADQSVVFAEDFEVAAIGDFAKRWDMVRNPEVMSLSDIKPEHSSGKQSLLISQVAENGTGGDLYSRLPDGYDRVFARFYVRFAEDCEPIHHFGTCIGGNNPATAWPQVRAGIPTQGDRAYWVGIEPFGNSWQWDYYAYWHQMRGSPPRGQTWGNSFIHDKSLQVEKERWICVEVMTKMNDVGQSNGEMALWIDGKLRSHLLPGSPQGRFVFDKFLPGDTGEGVVWDQELGKRRVLPEQPGGTPFPGFEWRTNADLKTNFVWLYVYITRGSSQHVNRIWFDDVVIATDYIGPISKR